MSHMDMTTANSRISIWILSIWILEALREVWEDFNYGIVLALNAPHLLTLWWMIHLWIESLAPIESFATVCLCVCVCLCWGSLTHDPALSQKNIRVKNKKNLKTQSEYSDFTSCKSWLCKTLQARHLLPNGTEQWAVSDNDALLLFFICWKTALQQRRERTEQNLSGGSRRGHSGEVRARGERERQR